MSDSSPVALDDPSALGFSANDLVGAVTDVVPSEIQDEGGTSIGQRDLEVSFAAESAQVETGMACLTEPAIAVDGTLTIEATDGWFSGSGPATLLGTGTEPGSLYLDGQFAVAPSPELQDAANAAAHGEPCSGSAVKVLYDVSVGSPPTPWAAALGSLDTEWCDQGGAVAGEETLYELVPPAP